MRVLTLRGPAVCRVLDNYAHTLRELRSYVPDLLLTGGAVRDVYFGRQVKDLDFMTCDDQAARVVSEYYGEAVRPCCDSGDDEEYEGDSTSLISAYETESKGANVLLVTNQHAHIAMFPDSISQIWTDGENVYASTGFNATVANRTITCTTRMTDERLERIQSKYKDFDFRLTDFRDLPEEV